MDLIKENNFNAVDIADDVLKAAIQTHRKESSLKALAEWELVMASGGEGAVIW